MVLKRPLRGPKDLKIRQELKNDPKERAENIMIVDLVRNDLSKFSVPGSVKVTELCKVYPFKQVNQMISTVESKLIKNNDTVSLFIYTFDQNN